MQRPAPHQQGHLERGEVKEEELVNRMPLGGLQEGI